LLPWLVPVGMILVGLVLLSSGLSDADEPTPRDVAPANVTTIVGDNALAWAITQVGAGVATEVDDVVMVAAVATGASTYSARAVVVRVDTRVVPPPEGGATAPTLSDADISTVATCVVWDVDVTSATYVPRAALEIERTTGRNDLTNGDATDLLRGRCREFVPG
jgi:hypothetical protein